VENRGDVEAWPEWTITGQVAGAEAANLTLGKVWSLQREVGAIAARVVRDDVRA
jgi:hypothetical protein